jgi:hypothetical protein
MANRDIKDVNRDYFIGVWESTGPEGVFIISLKRDGAMSMRHLTANRLSDRINRVLAGNADGSWHASVNDSSTTLYLSFDGTSSSFKIGRALLNLSRFLGIDTIDGELRDVDRDQFSAYWRQTREIDRWRRIDSLEN